MVQDGTRAKIIFSLDLKILFYNNFLKYLPLLNFMTDPSEWNPRVRERRIPILEATCNYYPVRHVWDPSPGPKDSWTGSTRNTFSPLPWQWFLGSLCRKVNVYPESSAMSICVHPSKKSQQKWWSLMSTLSFDLCFAQATLPSGATEIWPWVVSLFYLYSPPALGQLTPSIAKSIMKEMEIQ